MSEDCASTRLKTWTLCFLVSLIEGYDLQSAGLAAPRFAAQFGLDRIATGWVFSASTFGLFLGAILGGRLSDRYGRRTALTLSMLVLGIFSIGSALTTGFDDLLAMRLLTGIGLGGALPNIIAIAAEAGEARTRVARVTLIAAGMPAGGALASSLVLLVGGSEWRWIFHVGGAIPFLAAILSWTLLSSRLLAPAAALAPTGVANALFGQNRALRTLVLWIASFCTLLILHLLLNWLPTLLLAQHITGPSALAATIGFGAAGAIGALTLGLVIARRTRAATLLIVYAGLAASLIALGSTGQAVLWASACGFFVTGAQFALYGLSAASYPAAMRGTGTGAAVAMGRLGAIVGPLLAGAILGAGGDMRTLLHALVPIAAIAAAATALLIHLLRGTSPESVTPSTHLRSATVANVIQSNSSRR
jgi:MFS transporter, AAHS family, 3-hydroxyphenylpropionic acid transporter